MTQRSAQTAGLLYVRCSPNGRFWGWGQLAFKDEIRASVSTAINLKCSIRGREVLHQLSNYQLLNKDVVLQPYNCSCPLRGTRSCSDDGHLYRMNRFNASNGFSAWSANEDFCAHRNWTWANGSRSLVASTNIILNAIHSCRVLRFFGNFRVNLGWHLSHPCIVIIQKS